MVPSIRWTPWRENNLQGTRLGQFFSRNLPGPAIAFRGCDIAAEDPATATPTMSSAFINIPIGSLTDIKTVGICNKAML